jgi:hypothetical protein
VLGSRFSSYTISFGQVAFDADFVTGACHQRFATQSGVSIPWRSGASKVRLHGRENQMLILIIILVLLLGSGGGYYGHSRWGVGGGAGVGLGTILLVVLIVFLLGGFR